MPPYTIDPTELWAAIRRLADENDHSWRFTKKGDKRPAYDVEAGLAAKRAIKAKKQQAATERALAAARKRNSTARPAGQDIASRMLAAMQPGEWYGMGDLARMVGEGRHSRAKVHQTLVRRGWVERARNPVYSARPLSPHEIMRGGEPQPQHLYRLTEDGSQQRDRVAKMNGAV